MKINQITLVIVIALCAIFNLNVKSQDNLKQNLSLIKEKVGEVQIDKTVFRQSVDILDEEKAKVNYTSVEVDEKGKTIKESYEFYISDIDKNTIIRKTVGKKLFVSVSINNNQKFIKHFKEDKLDEYVNNIEILVSTADVAQEIIDLVKKSIPLVKTNDKSWNTNTDALNWLKNNVAQVTTSAGIFAQSFSFGERKDYLVSFKVKKTDMKSVTTEETYDLNILDINKNNIQVKITGTQLAVSIETKGNDKYIKYTKNNELQSYANDFQILAEDIDQARYIISAITIAIAKSKAKMPEFTSLQQSLDFIKNNTGDATIDAKSVKQKIEFIPGQGTKAALTIDESDSKGKSINYQYNFYLADLETNSLNFKVSGKKVTLFCNTKNKIKFIKYVKDNVQQDFQYDLEILNNDIETTREVLEAYKYALKASEVQPAAYKSITEAINFLTNNIKGETVNADQYKLTFEASTSEPYLCKFVKTKTDAKGVTSEQNIEFYPYTLDPTTTKVESSGKYLSVKALVKGKKPFVKGYKDGKQQSYDNEVEIIAFDAKQAKDIAEAITYMVNNGKPAEKDWSNKQVAMAFVKENVGNLKNESKEVTQKIELVNDDPCKVNLTVNTIDDKGKTIEEIYEFSLSDMNKMMVDYKISGKNVFVVLVCKNREKFVKVYKNGAQQSFGAEIEIMDDDVDTAKNLADALKAAIIQCEQ
jgi:hypothetical protein